MHMITRWRKHNGRLLDLELSKHLSIKTAFDDQSW